MTFDPKVRGARPAAVKQSVSGEKSTRGARKPQAAKASPLEDSAFERGPSPKLSAGVGDAAEGRRVRGGVADDSVGLGDVAEGRTKRGGVADDSIGRSRRGGVADDSIGAQPWVGLVGPETDPSRLALREALFDRLERPSYLDAPERAGAANLGSISRGLDGAVAGRQADKLLEAARPNKAVASRLDQTLAALRDAAPQVKSSLLTTFATAPAGAAGAIVEHVAASAAFKKLSVTDQLKLASVMARVDERGLRCLGLAMEKYPEVLADQDSAGGRLLDSLAQLASQPLNSKLYAKTGSDQLLTSVLVDIANPNRIEQGTAPTCTVTSMQFELVADEPAEYARLMAGLTGPQGSVKMRGGGLLQLGQDDGAKAARDGRSISQALFQSAAMEFANGAAAEFDPIAGKSTRADTGEAFAGLKPGQQTQILRNLFGVRYETKTLYSEQEGQQALEALRGWDSRGNLNRPVLLEIDQGKINHAVSLERIADGRVYFRDPYGTLRSMEEAKFAQVVVAVHQPHD